jgi:WD40 repeat protein
MIASSSYDRTIKLWKISDGSLFRDLIGHQSRVEFFYKYSQYSMVPNKIITNYNR